MTWRTRFRAASSGSRRFTISSPATSSRPAPIIAGCRHSWTATRSNSKPRDSASLTVKVRDELKRTWARETRLEREQKGLEGHDAAIDRKIRGPVGEETQRLMPKIPRAGRCAGDHGGDLRGTGRRGGSALSRQADPDDHRQRRRRHSDILARVIGAKLTESWGQQIIVDNRPGGQRADRQRTAGQSYCPTATRC